MAVLLQIKNAHKSYGDQVLLDGAEATIVDDVKVGFVGRNGAGKSTLLRVLIGEEELDVGEVIRHPKLRLGYLRQHDPFHAGRVGLGILDARQRPARLALRRSGRAVRAERGLSRRTGRQTFGRLANPGKTGGVAAARPQSAAAGRTDQLSRPADADSARAFSAQFQRGLPDRLARSGLLVGHVHPHARSGRGTPDDVPRPDRGLFGISTRRRQHEERTNSAVVAKRKQLQEFIDKNKARASTATRARSKSKQLERLELVDIDNDEPTANIRPPAVEPRKGPALRCRGLTIGYPERRDRRGHRRRDRTRLAARRSSETTGKAKRHFCGPSSIRSSRWPAKRAGAMAARLASTPSTSTPVCRPTQSVLDYLEYNAAPGTKIQQILDVAGALLFRGEAVKKRISVLSGGERARLCLAGLLLSQYNVLVLDEPGNHLDVDTVDGLAQALMDYKGTVVFTSHDRHFMHRVATCVVEVRDGHVTNYRGDYDSYLYAVNKEIDDGEREAGRAPGKPVAGKTTFAKAGTSHPAAAKPTGKAGGSKAAAGTADRQAPAAEARPGGRDERHCARRWAIPNGPLPGSTRKNARSTAVCSRRPIRTKPCGCTTNLANWPGNWPKPKTAGVNSKKNWASSRTVARGPSSTKRPNCRPRACRTAPFSASPRPGACFVAPRPERGAETGRDTLTPGPPANPVHSNRTISWHDPSPAE